MARLHWRFLLRFQKRFQARFAVNYWRFRAAIWIASSLHWRFEIALEIAAQIAAKLAAKNASLHSYCSPARVPQPQVGNEWWARSIILHLVECFPCHEATRLHEQLLVITHTRTQVWILYHVMRTGPFSLKWDMKTVNLVALYMIQHLIQTNKARLHKRIYYSSYK